MTAHPPATPVGAPPAPRFVEVGAHQLAVIVHHAERLPQEPEPLVFVHGLSMSVRFWERAMLAPIRHQPWVSVSLPLHFPSTYLGEDVDAADLSGRALADLLAGVLRAVVGERPVRLVGHSVGAMQALAFATYYPELCAGVFSVGGFTSGRAEGLEGGLRLLAHGRPLTRPIFRGVWRLKQRSRAFTEAVVLQYAADREAVRAYGPFEPTLDLVHPDMARHDLDALFRLMVALLEVELLPDAQAIACPVWAVAGTLDPIVAYEHQVWYARMLPTATLHPVEGAGHLPFAERPQIFEDLLLRFAATPRSA